MTFCEIGNFLFEFRKRQMMYTTFLTNKQKIQKLEAIKKNSIFLRLLSKVVPKVFKRNKDIQEFSCFDFFLITSGILLNSTWYFSNWQWKCLFVDEVSLRKHIAKEHESIPQLDGVLDECHMKLYDDKESQTDKETQETEVPWSRLAPSRWDLGGRALWA